MPLFKREKNGPVNLKVVQAKLNDVFGDRVRVHNSHRPFSRAGDIIVVRHRDKWIAAVARGPLGHSKSTIQLDQRNRTKLGASASGTQEFSFEEAGWMAQFQWAWNATDAVPRVAARLGIVSVILGALGLALGALSVILTLCQT